MGAIYNTPDKYVLSVNVLHICQMLCRSAKAYYDKNVIPHEHIMCERCGEISDAHVGDLTQLLRERSGLDITSYELNLRYICDACKAAVP